MENEASTRIYFMFENCYVIIGLLSYSTVEVVVSQNEMNPKLTLVGQMYYRLCFSSPTKPGWVNTKQANVKLLAQACSLATSGSHMHMTEN